MRATTYSKPPSLFLNYCNNLLTPFFVDHFQSFLITIIRETFLPCHLLRSLFYSNFTWLPTAISISSTLINKF